jgi:hypothetical protein
VDLVVFTWGLTRQPVALLTQSEREPLRSLDDQREALADWTDNPNAGRHQAFSV